MMIMKLILKDIRGYWRFIVLTIFLPGIAWSLLLFFPYYPAWGYVMFCSMAIFAAISYFSFSEKKQNLEILTCSLPVTRTAMVFSRYLLALIITFAGIILYYGAAYIGDLIYSHPVTNFSQINDPKVLLMSVFFIMIISSIFLPGIFCFKITGMIFNFIIAMIGAMNLTFKIFQPKKDFYSPYFKNNDLLSVLTLIAGMALALFISITLSRLHYKNKDL
ncbi:ABC-2 transporter permease [candidate division KSB1 bacterium]|nr:ABC-2 transporter permease [candidate division KSB1 bacterium]